MDTDHQPKRAGITPRATPHVPVLLHEVLDILQPAAKESYLDATAGNGGHAEHIIARTGAPEQAVLVDRDEQAVNYLHKKFKHTNIIHSDFKAASEQLAKQGKHFDLILADLGLSSMHIDTYDRGFSIKNRGPLDMRMDARQKLTADEVVNLWPVGRLTGIVREYGEEPRAERIAKAIASHRPIGDTHQLAEVVKKAATQRFRRRIHPATRTFQAIRIAVNGELEQLSAALPVWARLLNPGGRLAIISFHSLEDRIVKQYFAEVAADTYDNELRMLTKKPLSASKSEIDSNPRARSAKLRAAVKIKTKRKV